MNFQLNNFNVNGFDGWNEQNFLGGRKAGATSKQSKGRQENTADAWKDEVRAGILKKLSYQQKRILEEFPKLSKANDEAQRDLEKTLEDPSLFMNNPEQFKKTTEALLRLQEEQKKLEESWLEASLLEENLRQL